MVSRGLSDNVVRRLDSFCQIQFLRTVAKINLEARILLTAVCGISAESLIGDKRSERVYGIFSLAELAVTEPDRP